MKSISSIEAKFLRLNLNVKFTKLWKLSSTEEKNFFMSNIKLSENEKIILWFYPNPTFYWILTNYRLVVYHETNFRYFSLSEIKISNLLEVYPNGITLQDTDNLSIIYREQQYKIPIEKGIWHAIYNIFNFILSDK
jgi:hypothetical protein